MAPMSRPCAPSHMIVEDTGDLVEQDTEVLSADGGSIPSGRSMAPLAPRANAVRGDQIQIELPEGE